MFLESVRGVVVFVGFNVFGCQRFFASNVQSPRHLVVK